MTGLIIGRRRQGKSTLALRLCRTWHKTVFIFDPNAQFQGLETVTTTEDLEEWVNEDGEHGVIVFRPDPARIEDDFDDMVSLIWPLGNYALLIDEASAVQRPTFCHPQLERLMRQAPRDGARNADGRIVDVSVIQTTHRPQDVNNLCKALSSDTFLFQSQLQRDLDVVKEQWGEQVAATLPNLQRWNLTHVYSDLTDARTKYSVWRKPELWYLPIAAIAA